MSGAPSTDGVVTFVAPDKRQLADAISSRLIDVVAAAVAKRGVSHLVLTGGSMGTALLEALGRRGGDALPWGQVHLWWGDERFLPAGDADRNEVQAFDAFLSRADIPAGNVHRMAPSDGERGSDLEAAAADYAAELKAVGSARAEDGGDAVLPRFDVVMLGMGPDTHVASLFPGYAQTRLQEPMTAAVQDSPKPPPQRITLTFPALNSAANVWLMIAGADKADAVQAAWTSDDRTAHPASGVRGRETTTWWLDEAAAVGLAR